MFRELESEGYERYLQRNPFHASLGIDFNAYNTDLGGVIQEIRS